MPSRRELPRKNAPEKMGNGKSGGPQGSALKLAASGCSVSAPAAGARNKPGINRGQPANKRGYGSIQ
jgi:hypothetical protein